MQFLFNLGTLPVAVALLAGRRFRLEKSPKGITYSLANLMSTEQVRLGDLIRIDVGEDGELIYEREGEGAVIPTLLEKVTKAAEDAAKQKAAENNKPIAAVGHPALGVNPRRRPKTEGDGVKGPEGGTIVF
jgi:hypothetical protein